MSLLIRENSPVPKYYQLSEYLRHEIQAGRWTPGDKIPTESELMGLSGASRHTVRQAIAQLVNDGMLHSKRALGTFVAERKRTYSVGIGFREVSDLSRPFFSQLAVGIGNVVNSQCYHFNIMSTNVDEDCPQNMLRMVGSNRVEGIVICDHAVSDEVLRQVYEGGLPMVLIRRQVPGASIPSVLVDERSGTSKVTEHLIRLGHRRIGLHVGHLDRDVDKLKVAGFRDAMSAHGLEVDESLIYDCAGCPNSYDRALQFLDRPDLPPAFVVSDDVMAIDVIAAARRLNIRVPDDLAIVGFGDNLLHPARNPSLTTVCIPIEAMGEAAADLLFRQVFGKEIVEDSVMFEPELIVRESCGADLTRSD